MFKALTLAAGYFISYCVHTPQGRALAKRAIDEALKHMGAAEKSIARAIIPKPQGSDT